MKNFTSLFVTIVFLILTTNSSAQLSVGARVGINLSDQITKLKSKINKDIESVAGFSLAIPLEIGITEAFSVQAELTFIQKGSSASSSSFGLSLTPSTVYNYLELPILLKYKIISSGDFKMYTAIGPAFAYAVSGEIHTNNTKTSIEFDAESNKNFNRFEINLNFGVGFNLTLGPGDLVLDIRYRYGLSDVDRNDEVTTKNHGIGLSLGYMYVLSQ